LYFFDLLKGLCEAMDSNTKRRLQIAAAKIRIGSIVGTYNAKSGHPGGSLSIAEILAYLYFDKMNIDPADPGRADRDRFVLSKGHAAPALYAALANRGFFPVEELASLRKTGHFLQGHPDMKKVPGVDMSTGSLGQGISAACGMALSAKHRGADYRVYTIVGDGESEEGQVWEAAMFAASKHLDNLTAFVDLNHLQIDGTIEEVNSPLPLDEKFAAFGWQVEVIDGHDLEAIERAVLAGEKSDKPCAIICNTVKGKGVSFMENVCGWHGVAPNEEEYKTAMAELEQTLAALEK
jgi:transketolase